MDRIDWGTCENCLEENRRLFIFINHPDESVLAWVCNECRFNFEDAIERKQVPMLLGDKIQEKANALTPKDAVPIEPV